MTRTKPAAAILACAILGASVPWYAAAQNAPPTTNKKAPAKKKPKKGDKAPPADSAAASESAPAPPPPPPPPETASASATAEVPPPPASSAVTEVAPQKAAAEGSWKTTAGIISIGAGAVFLGGVYFFYKLNVNQNDDHYHAYARGFPPSLSTCDAAKANLTSPFLNAYPPDRVQQICSRSKTYTVLEFTSLGLGVVGIGLGIYWLATSGPPKPAKAGWEITPRVGQTTGLDLAVRF